MRLLHLAESPIRLLRIHTFLRLIDDHEVERKIRDPFQLVDPIFRKIGRTLQPLQRLESHHAIRFVLIEARIDILLMRKHARLPFQSIRLRNEKDRLLPGDEFAKILQPRIGDARPIRHNEHILRLHLPYKIIGCERLTESRLRIPEKFLPSLLEVHLRPRDSLRLLAPKRVGHPFLRLCQVPSAGKFKEIPLRIPSADLEPLRSLPARDFFIRFKEMVEIVVLEELSTVILVPGEIAPENLIVEPSGMCLLLDALLHALLRVADLRPAVILRVSRGGVGVNHGGDPSGSVDHLGCFHFISSPLHFSQ